MVAANGESVTLYTMSPSTMEKARALSRLRVPVGFPELGQPRTPGTPLASPLHGNRAIAIANHPDVHAASATPANPAGTNPAAGALPAAPTSGSPAGGEAAGGGNNSPLRAPKPFPGALPGHSQPVWKRPSLNHHGGLNGDPHHQPHASNNAGGSGAGAAAAGIPGPVAIVVVDGIVTSSSYGGVVRSTSAGGGGSGHLPAAASPLGVGLEPQPTWSQAARAQSARSAPSASASSRHPAHSARVGFRNSKPPSPPPPHSPPSGPPRTASPAVLQYINAASTPVQPPPPPPHSPPYHPHPASNQHGPHPHPPRHSQTGHSGPLQPSAMPATPPLLYSPLTVTGIGPRRSVTVPQQSPLYQLQLDSQSDSQSEPPSPPLQARAQQTRSPSPTAPSPPSDPQPQPQAANSAQGGQAEPPYAMQPQKGEALGSAKIVAGASAVVAAGEAEERAREQTATDNPPQVAPQTSTTASPEQPQPEARLPSTTGSHQDQPPQPPSSPTASPQPTTTNEAKPAAAPPTLLPLVGRQAVTGEAEAQQPQQTNQPSSPSLPPLPASKTNAANSAGNNPGPLTSDPSTESTVAQPSVGSNIGISTHSTTTTTTTSNNATPPVPVGMALPVLNVAHLQYGSWAAEALAAVAANVSGGGASVSATAASSNLGISTATAAVAAAAAGAGASGAGPSVAGANGNNPYIFRRTGRSALIAAAEVGLISRSSLPLPLGAPCLRSCSPPAGGARGREGSNPGCESPDGTSQQQQQPALPLPLPLSLSLPLPRVAGRFGEEVEPDSLAWRVVVRYNRRHLLGGAFQHWQAILQDMRARRLQAHELGRSRNLRLLSLALNAWLAKLHHSRRRAVVV
ncbi:hypothetical protein Agub_g9848, partial [Astrephomene gubernaculifera]